MRAISLHQPWASLWCSERKIHETRHWRATYRGWLLIHATKKLVRDVDFALEVILEREFGDEWAAKLPTGALIGMVNLIDCKPTQMLFSDAADNGDDLACGDFSPGRFAWRRGEFRIFRNPIPYRGAQGFFNVPDEILSRATA